MYNTHFDDSIISGVLYRAVPHDGLKYSEYSKKNKEEGKLQKLQKLCGRNMS